MKSLQGRSMTAVILVSLMAASASCGDDQPDGDGVPNSGVWTDSTSGLTWPTSHLEPMSWNDANNYCNELVLGGYDDWRLPTISELRTLVRGCPTQSPDGACGITDSCIGFSCQDSCYPCVTSHGPTNGCYGPTELPDECGCFWSSSGPSAHPSSTFWDFDFEDGFIDTNDYEVDLVRCVRPV